ncbi:nischarin-like [Pollicipes pollicipes]|uniref:nischarin-like n=1 Tax=Pollicipes pollicipes TaxID=41117 RepID=UPI00188592A1|nr:nischarin-like [Pollicipes pollicipes]
MAFHEPDQGNLCVEITSSTTTTSTTFYHVQVTVDACQWLVEHRYSAFADLNSQLVSDKLIPLDLLPGKKIIGNREPAFVDRRRQDLNTYIKRVVALLQLNMPDVLAKFLELETYDIGWMLRRQAFFCFVHEGAYVGGQRQLQMTPMEVQGLTRLVREGRADSFFHESKLSTAPSQVVDVASQTPSLRVAGSWQPLARSNVRPHTYAFSLELFRSLRKLSLHDVPVSSLASLAALRDRLVELSVSGGAVRDVRDVLLCGELHRDAPAADARPLWTCLRHLALRDNHIRSVDETAAALAPQLTSLDVSTNAVEHIGYLAELPALRQLNLSNNCLADVPDLHTRLGNVARLRLSQNRIGSLAPFARLFSLVQLDLSFNQVQEVEEVGRLRGLPCLEDLSLVGNPVTTAIDYRARALERLGPRAPHVTLDNEQSSQAQLDRVLVMQALRTAREGGPEFLRRGWHGRVVTIV